MPRIKDIKDHFRPIKVEKMDSPTIAGLSKQKNRTPPSDGPVIDLCSSPEVSKPRLDSTSSSDEPIQPVFLVDTTPPPNDSPPDLSGSDASSEIEFQRVTRNSINRLKDKKSKKIREKVKSSDVPVIELTSEAPKKEKNVDARRKRDNMLPVPKEKPKEKPILSDVIRNVKDRNVKDPVQEKAKLPQIIPAPSNLGLPKFNIVHADKTQKPPPPTKKRARSPSPLKFALVLQNQTRGQTVRRPRGPRKKSGKAVLQDVTTQTIDERINPAKDLSCHGCKKLFADVNTTDSIENAILETCLEYWKQQEETKAKEDKIKAICAAKKSGGNPLKAIKDASRMSAPTHKVPTVKIKEAKVEELKKPEVTDSFNGNLEANTTEIPMEVEPTPTPSAPKVTFTWDAHKPEACNYTNIHTVQYSADDFLDCNRNMPSLIPQGAFKAKPIIKQDDVARIGKFNELYDNPLRPKLLDVEHPPEKEDAQSLIKSNVAFFAEFEPELPDIDPELAEIFADISDDEDDAVEAKFSDDEDNDETPALSDTQLSESMESMSVCDELPISDDGLFGDDVFNNFDVDALDPLSSPTPQEPAPVVASKRIEAEIEKTMTKTLLEIVNDDELDFDDAFDDDLESPAYEPITAEKSPEMSESEPETPKKHVQTRSTDSGIGRASPEDSPSENSPVETSSTLSNGHNSPPITDSSQNSSIEAIVSDIEKLKETIKTCTNELLTEIYGYCVTDRDFFLSHFELIATEMGTRSMTDLIMRAIRVCEQYEALSHYKLIVNALILAGFQNNIAVKYISDNCANAQGAIDVLIELIFDHDVADNMLDYLKKYSKSALLKYSSLERLLTYAINTENTENGSNQWKNLVEDILANRNSRQQLHKNPELREKTMAWLGKHENGKIQEEIKEVKPVFAWRRTITNNKFVENATKKLPPPLLPITTTTRDKKN